MFDLSLDIDHPGKLPPLVDSASHSGKPVDSEWICGKPWHLGLPTQPLPTAGEVQAKLTNQYSRGFHAEP